MATARQLHVK